MSVEQFETFLRDAKYFEQHPAEHLDGYQGNYKGISKSPDSPIQEVNWNDAASAREAAVA